MKRGDRLQVIAEDSEFAGWTGVMVGCTRYGQVIVEFAIEDDRVWRQIFRPHDVDLAPTVDWTQTVEEPAA